jgi:hypothetical protein
VWRRSGSRFRIGSGWRRRAASGRGRGGAGRAAGDGNEGDGDGGKGQSDRSACRPGRRSWPAGSRSIGALRHRDWGGVSDRAVRLLRISREIHDQTANLSCAPLDSASILPVMSLGSGTEDRNPRTALLSARATSESRIGGRGRTVTATTLQEAQERVYQDRTLTCRDCSEEFTFSAGEQAFFSSKGLLNDPQRCPVVQGDSQAGEDRRWTEGVPCGDLWQLRWPGDGAIRAAERPPGLLQLVLRQGPGGNDGGDLGRRLIELQPRSLEVEPRGRPRRLPGLDWASRSQPTMPRRSPMGVIIIREMVGTSPRSWSDAADRPSRPRRRRSATSRRSRS